MNHSLYVHLLSRSELKIRWMLNLYVNFNIEAILYLKNKINASISFLMWYWVLSLLGEKSFPNASSPNSNLRGQRSLGRGNFAFCWCSSQWYASLFPQYHLLSQCEGWIARVEGFFLNDNGVYLLIGFWEFAWFQGLSRVPYIPQAKLLDSTKSKFRGTPLVVQWLPLHLPMRGFRVWSLIREPRSHMPCGQKTKT